MRVPCFEVLMSFCLELGDSLQLRCASFLCIIFARARARAPSELDRFSMKAEQFREITGHFLLNELGDPHFLIHKFKWHTVR